METLVVYDNTGHIINVVAGNFYEPQGGIQYLVVNIPTGKILKGVDMDTHEAILEDMPKSEMELIREELTAAQQALDFLLFGGL